MEQNAVPASLRGIVLRVLAFQALYLVFHFAYGWFPGPITAIFSGTDESVFQHMKVGFFAWLAVSIGEWAILRPAAFGTFIASRSLVSVIGPYVFVLVWFLAPAIVGRMPNDALEVIWANLVVCLSGIFMARIEDRLAERRARASFIVLSLCLFVVFLYLSQRFTAELPWIDLFAPPA